MNLGQLIVARSLRVWVDAGNIVQVNLYSRVQPLVKAHLMTNMMLVVRKPLVFSPRRLNTANVELKLKQLVNI